MTDAKVNAAIAKFAATPRFKDVGACDEFLHHRDRIGIKRAVETCVSTYYKANRAKFRSGLHDLGGADIIYNGQKLLVSELLVILDDTRHARAWIKTSTIEALLMTSRAAKKLWERSSPKVQIFGPALGRDFYEEGDINSVNEGIKTQYVDIAAQLFRLQKEATPLAPHADAVRLATLARVAEQGDHLRRKIILEQARWRGWSAGPDSWRELKLEQWHALIVFYGDNTHWRLALVLRYGMFDQLAHIVYDPLYRMLRPDDPGHVDESKVDQVERFMCIMRGMSTMGYNVLSSWPILVEGATPGDQKDGWSCGWRAFMHFEAIANYLAQSSNADLVYDEDADKNVLALFGMEAKEEKEQLAQCERLRTELRDIVECILALVHHVGQDEIRKENAAKPSTTIVMT